MVAGQARATGLTGACRMWQPALCQASQNRRAPHCDRVESQEPFFQDDGSLGPCVPRLQCNQQLHDPFVWSHCVIKVAAVDDQP